MMMTMMMTMMMMMMMMMMNNCYDYDHVYYYCYTHLFASQQMSPGGRRPEERISLIHDVIVARECGTLNTSKREREREKSLIPFCDFMGGDAGTKPKGF